MCTSPLRAYRVSGTHVDEAGTVTTGEGYASPPAVPVPVCSCLSREAEAGASRELTSLGRPERQRCHHYLGKRTVLKTVEVWAVRGFEFLPLR
jgi:hypothetical protein